MPSATLSDAVPEFEKRSRAVLVADVVGYSRLMEAAEFETHARMRALRVNVCDPSIVSHRGEVVKNTGDGFIAIFESPLDAVQCAAELQQEFVSQAARHPPERRIAFRIGLHWEPVILDGNDVFGGGVNIAVRLQTSAPAGGVVVSAALKDVLDDRSGLTLDDLGELRLKNLSRPIHAFALRLPGVDPVVSPGKALGAAKLPSVAVLPFTNLSGEPKDRYFADGFAEDIIVTLSNLPELLVVSRGSTIKFRGHAVDSVEISERLGVRYLLSGSIRGMNGRIRISVELLDASTASLLWAESYDAEMKEIFNVQDEIAVKIVGKIATYIRRSEIRQAMRKPPHSLDAYDCLLQALDLLYRLDFASFSRARTFLERAREEDPGYAAPYAYSAHWHMFNIAEGWSTDSDADTGEVIRLSQCAIERDPCNGYALAIQGHARSMFHRDYDAAVDLFDRALAVSPNNSWAWVFSSGTYGFIGDPAAGIARAERAIRLSPLDDQAFFNLCLLAQNHYLNGTFEDAIRWSRKSLSLNPRFGNTVRVLAASLVAVGRHEEAQTLSRYHTQILPRFRVSDYARRCPFKEPQASLYIERLGAAGIQA
jgi:adenylate cyclase